MKKVLFIATVVKTHINTFHLPYLEWFKKNGYEVSVAAKNDFEPKSLCEIPHCDKFYDLNFKRFPVNKENFLVYRKLKKIINENNYDIIHCHTPVGGVIGRLASRKAKSSKIIYTAHGYHFWKGAPITNWIIYCSVEKTLAKYTDHVILINKDDYELAKKHNMAKNIHYIPGVGIDIDKYRNPEEVENTVLAPNNFNMTFIGELNKNKNQLLLLEVVNLLKNDYPNIMLNLVGNGSYKEIILSKIKEMKLENHVNLLGFRKDIPQILNETDLVLSPSLREGLPVNIMESMAAGKPIIVTDCRGNRDLIMNGVNGFLVNYSAKTFKEKIELIINDEKLRKKFADENIKLAEIYDIKKILSQYVDIYNKSI